MRRYIAVMKASNVSLGDLSPKWWFLGQTFLGTDLVIFQIYGNKRIFPYFFFLLNNIILDIQFIEFSYLCMKTSGRN